MKYQIVLPLILFFAFSCAKKSENKNVKSWPYQSKTFRLESPGGCRSDTLSCAVYEINYPVFEGLSAAANDSLTRKISEAVDTGNPELDSSSFEVAGKSFISSFEKVKKEMPDQAVGWYYKSTLTVNVNTDTLISIKATNDFFTGGAHGGNGIYFINLEPASGKTIFLSDILKPGYEATLRKEGEISFRKSLQLANTTSLSDQGFEFPENKFSLNDNYGFTKDGVVFVFNVYEIAPYALGEQEVLISYDRLKEWLK